MVAVNGLVALMIRVLFVCFSFAVMRQVNWQQLMHERWQQNWHYVYGFVSLALGHIVASCMLEWLQILQNLLFSQFL